MDIIKIKRYFNTLKHLKAKQIFYQVYYRIRKLISWRKSKMKVYRELEPLDLIDSPNYANSFLGNNRFSFLNIEKNFEDGNINWNYSAYGKLWTYNLNYFDFLNQSTISENEGLNLINDYIFKRDKLRDGLDPYPISLRGINWIKFLSRYQIKDERINSVLFQDYQLLKSSLEYHLLANHLLENAMSLLFAAFYFHDYTFYNVSVKILKKELKEQIMDDGAHFELSPMYHQIILFRALECYNLIISNKWELEHKGMFETIIPKMLGWLNVISFSDGKIPLVNDSANGIAPNTFELNNYAAALGLKEKEITLGVSGYRKYKLNGFELLVDVGNISPSYQPGHSHADTFNFVLYFNDRPLFVDTGVSTYEINNRRLYERSSLAHNTVTVNGINSSDVWSGFRVGQRACVQILEEDKFYIKASHNGYCELNCQHYRSWRLYEDCIMIEDYLTSGEGIATFVVAPELDEVYIKNQSVIVEDVTIKFEGEVLDITIDKNQVSEKFNILQETNKIQVRFSEKLIAKIISNN